MVFSSPIFLFKFLPIVLLLYFIVPGKTKNLFLVLASLIFYAWGEFDFVLVMIVSIIANYYFGLWIDKRQADKRSKTPIILAVAFNLGILVSVKYLEFIIQNIIFLLEIIGIDTPILKTISYPPLPIGVSFFTFQALSYIFDVYRKGVPGQRNFINIAVYISLFPQLIAGPIIRYHDINNQITRRETTLQDLAEGTKRFIIGLGKKALIANTLGLTADNIFLLPSGQISPSVSWLGVICYSLQIYFDFSGYSDMAIGLGRMFGFKFLENFNYPYISQSIREYWTRWHISLSNWFRDYLYIPLGGNRVARARLYLNLLTVFFLCGLWHGASWNFVIWGLFHGLFLILERGRFGKALNALWKPLRHFYAILVILIGFVIFRTESMKDAVLYIYSMFHFSNINEISSVLFYFNLELTISLTIGIIGCLPIPKILEKYYKPFIYPDQIKGNKLRYTASAIVAISFLMSIFIASAISLSSETYNPFIYFRF